MQLTCERCMKLLRNKSSKVNPNTITEPKSKKYITEYAVGTEKFGSHVWAVDIDTARLHVEFRNIGETISGVVEDAVEGEGNASLAVPGFYHYAMFVGWLAVSAGYTNDEIFGDRGICHEAIHAKANVLGYTHISELEHYHEVMTRFIDLECALGLIEAPLSIRILVAQRLNKRNGLLYRIPPLRRLARYWTILRRLHSYLWDAAEHENLPHDTAWKVKLLLKEQINKAQVMEKN